MNNIFYCTCFDAMNCPHSMSHSAYITAIKHGKHGREHVTLVSIVHTKLKIMFNTYASFHFSVTEDDLPHIHKTGVCPDGCLIAPFYGRAQTKFLIRIHVLHLDPCHLV